MITTVTVTATVITIATVMIDNPKAGKASLASFACLAWPSQRGTLLHL
jgi:hypothetical protein